MQFAALNLNGLTSFHSEILLMKKRENYGRIDSVPQFVEARPFNNTMEKNTHSTNLRAYRILSMFPLRKV